MDTVAVDLTGVRATALIELYARWLDRYIDALLSCVGLEVRVEGNGPTGR